MSFSFVEAIRPYLEALRLPLTEAQAALLERLGESLLRDPFYASVSKISDPAEVASKHFLDSLAPLGLGLPVWKNAQTILDLGTGGGFPALPLGILFPGKQIIAVDARAKAVDFVARRCEEVGLKNVRVVQGRGEELGRQKEYRDAVDLVVCRAVAAVRILVELCVPLVRPGGYALFYKGPKLEEELNDAAQAFAELRVADADVLIHQMTPPLLPFERGFVQIRKSRPTPEKYPRRNGIPAAKPL